jgi:hypothetical protein
MVPFPNAKTVPFIPIKETEWISQFPTAKFEVKLVYKSNEQLLMYMKDEFFLHVK